MLRETNMLNSLLDITRDLLEDFGKEFIQNKKKVR